MKKSNEKEKAFIGVLLQTLISIVAIGVAFHFGGLIPAGYTFVVLFGGALYHLFFKPINVRPKISASESKAVNTSSDYIEKDQTIAKEKMKENTLNSVKHVVIKGFAEREINSDAKPLQQERCSLNNSNFFTPDDVNMKEKQGLTLVRKR